MKTHLFAAYLVSSLCALSGETEIGVIVSTNEPQRNVQGITVSHEYDGKGTLTLSISNIEMNAAARGVTGSAVVEGKRIIIKPKELYDATGPVESLLRYTIRYVIPDVIPGRYTLVHEDSASEGQDRMAMAGLDLRVAGKGTVKINFDAPETEEDPFAE